MARIVAPGEIYIVAAFNQQHSLHLIINTNACETSKLRMLRVKTALQLKGFIKNCQRSVKLYRERQEKPLSIDLE